MVTTLFPKASSALRWTTGLSCHCGRRGVWAEWYSRGREVIRPEMTRIDIPVGKAVIDRTEGYYPVLARYLDLRGAKKPPRISAFHRGLLGKDVALYKSEVGAPAVAMVMEVMIASGVRTILMLGLAESLSPSCPIGTAVIPTWGLREEGTSYHHLPSGTRPTPSSKFVTLLSKVLSELDPKMEGVWSTDAPYRETREKVRKCAKQGVLAVDTETTAMMAVAMRRKADFAAVLTISDIVYESDWSNAFGTRELNCVRNFVCEESSEIILS